MHFHFSLRLAYSALAPNHLAQSNMVKRKRTISPCKPDNAWVRATAARLDNSQKAVHDGDVVEWSEDQQQAASSSKRIQNLISMRYTGKHQKAICLNPSQNTMIVCGRPVQAPGMNVA